MHNFPKSRNGFKQNGTQILTPFTVTGFHIMVHFALVVNSFLELALTSDKILSLGAKINAPCERASKSGGENDFSA